MLSLDEHRRADGLCTPINHPALLFLRTRCQQQVQLCQIQDLRHRYQIVTPELTSFAFHAAFLMPLARRAELRFEPPVRTERDKSRRLFPLMTPQTFPYPTLQVVVTQLPEHAAFLMPLARRAELRFEPPVRTQRDKSRRLFP